MTAHDCEQGATHDNRQLTGWAWSAMPHPASWTASISIALDPISNFRAFPGQPESESVGSY